VRALVVEPLLLTGTPCFDEGVRWNGAGLAQESLNNYMRSAGPAAIWGVQARRNVTTAEMKSGR